MGFSSAFFALLFCSLDSAVCVVDFVSLSADSWVIFAVWLSCVVWVVCVDFLGGFFALRGGTKKTKKSNAKIKANLPVILTAFLLSFFVIFIQGILF